MSNIDREAVRVIAGLLLVLIVVASSMLAIWFFINALEQVRFR